MKERFSFAISLVLILCLLLGTVGAASASSARKVDSISIDIQLDKEELTVGEPVKATWTISGVQEPLPYEDCHATWYVLYDDPQGHHMQLDYRYEITGLSGTVTFTPQWTNADYWFAIELSNDSSEEYVYVDTDMFHTSGSLSAKAPLIEITTDKARYEVGDKVKASWTYENIDNPVYDSAVCILEYVDANDDIHWGEDNPDIGTNTEQTFTVPKCKAFYIEVHLNTTGDYATVYGSTRRIPVGNEPDDPVPPEGPAGNPVTAISLNKTALSIADGKTAKLKAKLTPKKPDDKTITWSSSDEAVAMVSDQGVVTAVDPGTATITATASSGVSAECAVTVTPVAVKKVKPSKKKITLTAGSVMTLAAKISPANATDQAVTWTSDNEAVATVADGVVTAVAPGTAVITVTAANGKAGTCKVTVK